MTVIPKISGVPRASIIRRAVAVKVVRSAPPPVTTPVCAAGIDFKNHAANSGSAGSNPETDSIPNRLCANWLDKTDRSLSVKVSVNGGAVQQLAHNSETIPLNSPTIR
jgi:hypothetical protein